MPHFFKQRVGLCISLGALCVSLPITARAQGSASWTGAPLVGLMTNAEMTEVRAIVGVIGASTVSDPIAMPRGTRHVYLAPGQQWALVDGLSGQTLGRMPFDRTQPGDVTPIHGALASPDVVSFSPAGRSAVVVSRSAGLLQVVTGLDGTPQVAMEIQIADLIAVGPLAVAVSDDGTLPVAMGQDGSAFLLSGTSRRLIFGSGAPSAMSFIPGEQALVIADGSAATVSILDGLAQTPFTRASISGPKFSSGNLVAQVTGDAQVLIVGALGTNSAYRVDLTHGGAQAVAVGATVSRLERLRDANAFLFSANAGESSWLLYSDGPDLRAGFAQPGRRTPNRNSGSVTQEVLQ